MSALALKAGGTAWLLRHECRLFFYELGSSNGVKAKAGKRGMSVPGMAVIAVALLALHFLVWSMLRVLPPLTREPAFNLIRIAGVALAVVFSFMLSLGLSSSVKALFERGDLDLLLSSPLPSRHIFTVRLLGITLGVSAIFLVFLTPFAHVGLLLGQPRWLGIYPVLISMALLASSLSILLTLLLVRLIGVRRTRTAAQLLGALSGAVIFLMSQAFGSLGQGFRGTLMARLLPLFEAGAVLGPDSGIWLPARAVFGAPLEVLAFGLCGVAFFMLTVHFTHQFFVRGVQQAAGVSVAAKRPAGPVRLKFRSGLWSSVLRKEWRLIVRDPHLISQIFMQLLYLLPMFFLIFLKKDIALPGIAASMTFLVCSLAASLIWIIISAEEAPDLLQIAPADQATIRHAKLAAAFIPILALVLPALFWLMLKNFAGGLVLAIVLAAAMLAVSLTNLWLAKPGSRAQFNKRGASQWIANSAELLASMAWAGAAYFGVQFNIWGLLPLALALSVLGLAWLMRITRAQ
jgi:ABC-2 type transport system permease protein